MIALNEVISTLNIGEELSIADRFTKELGEYILVTVGAKKYMRLMITQERDMLIKNGLIMKNKSASTSGKKDSGAHLT
jgi:hypothetical protein